MRAFRAGAEQRRPRRGLRGTRRAWWLALALVALGPSVRAETESFRVVLDAGHGGADHGARSARGALEKDVVLQITRRIGSALERAGVEVTYTRSDDRFVPLAERTEIANRAGADLFLSIHANSAPQRHVRGVETYFLSLEASDDEARRVAMTENEVFGHEAAVRDSDDLVGAVLGDLIRTQLLRDSQRIAGRIQRELARATSAGRGVKQAPFVVLMGVNMPAALLEVGFLTHAGEADRLARADHQRRLAGAIARAVLQYRARQMRARTAGPGPEVGARSEVE